MTAVAPAVGRRRPATVPWLALARIAWLRHRTALIAFIGFAALAAIGMALTGMRLHGAEFSTSSRLFVRTTTVLTPALLSLPVLAGMFLGAPLVAREIETGTARFSWVQGAGRTRPLVAVVLPAALLLAIVAAGLGLEHRWWLTSAVASNVAWEPGQFSLSPLPFLGWTVFGLSLGVFLGALIRRTVPAMAATFACYALLLYNVAIPWLGWRYHYLPPLRASVQPNFTAGGNGMTFSYSSGGAGGPGSDFLSSGLGWPGGRLLGHGQYSHPAAWFRLHHIQVWLTYQPASRLGVFQFIEAGWLVAVSVALIAATIFVVRRRAA